MAANRETFPGAPRLAGIARVAKRGGTKMLALVLAAVVSTSSIPSLDISAGCKPASPMEDQDINYKSCMEDEEATKQKLTKEWGTYPVAARHECVSDRSSLVDSYVELLTCIEMQTWKNDPNTMNPGNGPATGPGGHGGSPPLPGQMGGSSTSHPLGGTPGAHMP
jgi:hypothetical protein